MAFLRDDDALSFAVLAICDALETTDATRMADSLTKARKHAHSVINRGKKQQDHTPVDPVEGKEDE
jgi:hypothetical protein